MLAIVTRIDAYAAVAVELGVVVVLLRVAYDVVSTYSELRGTERRLHLAEKNVQLLERTHRLVVDKHRTGLASGLDLERASAEGLAVADARRKSRDGADMLQIHRQTMTS